MTWSWFVAKQLFVFLHFVDASFQFSSCFQCIKNKKNQNKLIKVWNLSKFHRMCKISPTPSERFSKTRRLQNLGSDLSDDHPDTRTSNLISCVSLKWPSNISNKITLKSHYFSLTGFLGVASRHRPNLMEQKHVEYDVMLEMICKIFISDFLLHNSQINHNFNFNTMSKFVFFK